MNPTSVGEADGATAVVVTAATAALWARTTAVTVAVGEGPTDSATEGTDLSDFTVTIGANATSGTGTFTLTPTQDGEGERSVGDGTDWGTSLTLTTRRFRRR